MLLLCIYSLWMRRFVLVVCVWETFPLYFHAVEQNETKRNKWRKKAAFRGNFNVNVLTFQTSSTAAVAAATAAVTAAKHKQSKQSSFNTRASSLKFSSFIHHQRPPHSFNNSRIDVTINWTHGGFCCCCCR